MFPPRFPGSSIRVIGEGDPGRAIKHRHEEAVALQGHAHRQGAFRLDGFEVGEGVQGVGDKVRHWAWLKSCGSEPNLSLIVETSAPTSGTPRILVDGHPGHPSSLDLLMAGRKYKMPVIVACERKLVMIW